MNMSTMERLGQLAILTALMQRAHPGAIQAMGIALKRNPDLYLEGEDLFIAEYGVKESDTGEPALPRPQARRSKP